MIEKSTILITSIGRTGTEFFANLFADILPNCTSLHEPDIYKFVGVENRLVQYRQQTLRAGIWRMILLKAIGKWTLAKISDSRFRNNLSNDQATKYLYKQRVDFISKMPGSVYVESNLGYYGLLDVTPNVFEKYRAIYIIRDGRDWIRSMMNWGEVYGKKGIRNFFSHKWPTAADVKDDPLAEKWHMMTRFEQLCWAWARLNGFALNSILKNPNAKVFHFENIFTGEQRYQYLGDLLNFATSLPDIDHTLIGKTDGWLERKIHQSSDGFPDWGKWSTQQCAQFQNICGPLMDKLGYKF